MRVSFEIPTTPYGKARHRTGINGMMYKDKVTENFENLVKVMYQKATKHFFEDAIELYFVFNFSIPESYSKKKKKSITDGEIKYTKKPDIDNLIKSIMDGLNKTAYKDDSQVYKIGAKKQFAERDSIQVVIKDTEEN